MPPAANISFRLGNISFKNFEVPETIDHFGGEQRLVVHDFPGGVRIIQDFGDFPPEVISWSGMLFNDSETKLDIETRVRALDQMRRAADPVVLSFGIFEYLVRIWRIRYTPKLEVWVPYTIEVVPFFDYKNSNLAPPSPDPTPRGITPGGTGFAGIPTAPAVATNSGAAAPPLGPNLPSVVKNSDGSFSSSFQLSDGSAMTTRLRPQNLEGIANSNNQLGRQLQFSDQFPQFPPDALNNLTTFQKSLFQALQEAQDSSIPLRQDLIDGYNDALAPLPDLSNSPLPQVGAFGSILNGIMDNIGSEMFPTPATLNTVPVINPNLIALSEETYGSGDFWQQIAFANRDELASATSGSNTPFPVGSFRLVLPAVS